MLRSSVMLFLRFNTAINRFRNKGATIKLFYRTKGKPNWN